MDNTSSTFSNRNNVSTSMRSSGPIRNTQSRTRLRRFVFTLNNYTEHEYNSICATPCTWLIVGKETGAARNTPHLQGAVVLGKQMAFSSVKKLPGFARAHIEPMCGEPADSVEYCSKEDKTPFQKGTMPKPGKRNDLRVVCSRIVDEGHSLADISRDIDGAVAIVKYHRGLTYLRSLSAPHRTPPVIMWLHGATGTGKTRTAVEFAEHLGLSYWISHGSLQWFDSYDGQEVAILDDYRTGHCTFSFLLRLLDVYRFSVPVKGNYVPWRPKYIIVTAPKPPLDMWNLRSNEDLKQLSRRIHGVFELGGQYIPDLFSLVPGYVKPPASDEPVVISDDSCATTEEYDASKEEITENLLDLVRRSNELSAESIRCSERLIEICTTESHEATDSDEEMTQVIDLTGDDSSEGSNDYPNEAETLNDWYRGEFDDAFERDEDKDNCV